jgi:DNA-binding NtrC family response regulator
VSRLEKPPTEAMIRRRLSRSTLIRTAGARAHRGHFVCLVVDHGPNGEPGLAQALEVEGLEVLTAKSAAEALSILAERPVDIVVAEECLPCVPGSRLLETVHHDWPRVGRVLVGRDLGPDIIIQAVNRARVQRVLPRRTPAVTLRVEVEAALNETLLARSDSELSDSTSRRCWRV